MPVECGRYLWDDEPVTVYWQDDVLMGETSSACEPITDLDLMFRAEYAMHHMITTDAPWQPVGDCYEDGCESARHNAKLDLPGGDFDSFIGQCENLAEEMERKNPFDACGDGERVRKLIEIARAWRSNE